MTPAALSELTTASNVRVREALERLRRLFDERPGAARKRNSSATAVWRHGLQCEITGSHGEKAASDMPRAMGGEGTAPNPGWLLCAAMASCTATNIAMHAAMRGIELSTLEVSVDSETDARGMVGISGVSTALIGMRVSIIIGANDATQEQLRELAESGEALSAVGCTLRERPAVAVEVAVV
jgi:uncharacterized OsmC-like protein